MFWLQLQFICRLRGTLRVINADDNENWRERKEKQRKMSIIKRIKSHLTINMLISSDSSGVWRDNLCCLRRQHLLMKWLCLGGRYSVSLCVQSLYRHFESQTRQLTIRENEAALLIVCGLWIKSLCCCQSLLLHLESSNHKRTSTLLLRVRLAPPEHL